MLKMKNILGGGEPNKPKTKKNPPNKKSHPSTLPPTPNQTEDQPTKPDTKTQSKPKTSFLAVRLFNEWTCNEI